MKRGKRETSVKIKESGCLKVMSHYRKITNLIKIGGWYVEILF